MQGLRLSLNAFRTDRLLTYRMKCKKILMFDIFISGGRYWKNGENMPQSKETLY